MRPLAAALCLLLGALSSGCISPAQKAMNVELKLVRWDRSIEPSADGLNVRITINVSAENAGDPGNVTVLAKLCDDEGKILVTKRETFHLDPGQARFVTIVIEKTLPQGFDAEAVYPVLEKEKTQVD